MKVGDRLSVLFKHQENTHEDVKGPKIPLKVLNKGIKQDESPVAAVMPSEIQFNYRSVLRTVDYNDGDQEV